MLLDTINAQRLASVLVSEGIFFACERHPSDLTEFRVLAHDEGRVRQIIVDLAISIRPQVVSAPGDWVTERAHEVLACMR